MEEPEPRYVFVDSRRLTGPNRYFEGPAVTLTPIGPAAQDSVALERWAELVRRGCAALGWPDPAPVIERVADGPYLIFRAPADAQLTATELSEWAWETASAETAAAHPEVSDPQMPGFDRAHPLGAEPLAVFAARAAAERPAVLAGLRSAAARLGLPVFEDDEEISLGAGSGSLSWRLDALPSVETIPWSSLHDIPTVLVTGSNGKTTTVRLLAAMASASGAVPGYSSTEGVFVGGRAVALGDYSGPAGARVVLRCPEVTLAVLETARGGILRRGLAVARANAAVITNISADHFGEYGIENAEDLAETKLVVARAVRDGGTLVLNADDATLMSAASRLPHAAGARQALFAWDDAHPALQDLRRRGGSTCAVRERHLVLHHQGAGHDLGELAALPLTWQGAARYNVANLAAAALAAAVIDVAPAAIRLAAGRFGGRPEDNPGRLERWSFHGAAVLIDYAHNPDGLGKLLTVARSLQPKRLLLLLGQAGNRDDRAIVELAGTAAGFRPDWIAIKELPLMLRGRAVGEVPALLEQALQKAGIAAERMERYPDEEMAARSLLAGARAGDVIVLPVHTREVREHLHSLLSAGEVSAPVGNGDPNHILGV